LKQYVAKRGAPFPVDKAQEIGEALEDLCRRYGCVTPAAVVEEAMSPSSPFHDCFTWDNDVAAVEMRLHQARLLINHIEVKLTVTGKKKEPDVITVYYNVSVPDPSAVGDDGRKRIYQDIDVVMANDGLKQQVIASAWRSLVHWREKYKQLKEFSGVFAEIDRLEGEIEV